MDAGTAIGVAVAAAVVILLAIFIYLWICPRIRKRNDGIDSSTSYQAIVEQTDRALPYAFEDRIERKKGVGFYEGSQNAPPKNPPPNQ